MKTIVFCVVFLYGANGFLFPKVKTVDKLDLNKYLGRWYEVYSSLIQRQTFQRNSVCTTATYKLKSDGNVNVFNAGITKTAKGAPFNATGTAVPVKGEAGKFIVNFDVAPFKTTSPNYLVIKLGPETHGKDGLYEYTVISTPRKALVWVLARNAKQFKAKYDAEVRQYLEKNGFTWFWNKPHPTYQGDDCVYPPM
ncbi:outer membrane lipoprotein Blc-like [Hydractinia symbiolongicarpus]|uniref:outer membrane lipoprotein Blc-like n=1 Tax=Hydractinia symbiolongicarpus TaxID=13093 RepID=UPI00254C5275|nr:outer membrane lipoprotein Blc-like [Hydractinia symbiolongicarpus]